MWIEIHNLYCKVTKHTDDEIDWLSDYLSFKNAQAKYRWKVPKWKRGDDMIHMLSEITKQFPTGFLDSVKKQAAVEKIKLNILDKRIRPVRAELHPFIDWLRSYQDDAIQVARTKERGVFHHSTGAGKTEVMVGLGELHPTTWLILTHKKDLVIQTARRFADRTGEELGRIGDGKFNPKRITIMTFQTLYNKLRKSRKGSPFHRWLMTIRGVMVDECHIVPAKTFYRVIMALENAYYRYGFSGTPFARGDKKSLYTWGALGPVIHRVEADTLIKAGVLAKPKIRMITVKQQRSDAKMWDEVYKEGIVNNKLRNAVVIASAIRAEKPCLLFVKEIFHGKLLEKQLRQKGIPVEFVWGKDKVAVRQAAIRRLVHGDVDILIGNVIFQEGIDIPELQSVINAQGGKSFITVLQNVGRGMRRRDRKGNVTKEEFEVIDIADRGCGCAGTKKHRGCKWLEKHTRTRMRAYALEKYEVIEDRTFASSLSERAHFAKAS